MKPRQQDDWGPVLGSDKDVYVPPVPKPPKADTPSGLVYYFRDQMLLDTSTLMNSQVNGPAMIKAFRKILDTGRTYDDVRAMIKQFHKDIQSKPLTDGIPAWKAFMGRLDTLANKVGYTEPLPTYDAPKVDPRLMEDNDG